MRIIRGEVDISVCIEGVDAKGKNMRTWGLRSEVIVKLQVYLGVGTLVLFGGGGGALVFGLKRKGREVSA